MPLLVCPNDNTAMQVSQREGVEFDFCPSCRGVWLDRGELEKLMGLSAHRAPERRDERDGRDERSYDRDRAERRARYDDDDDDRRGGYGAPRKKGFSLFDIFD